MYRIVISGASVADPAQVVPAALERALTQSVLLLERSIKPKVPIGVTSSARGSIAGEVRMGEAIGVGTPIGVIGSPMKHVAVLNDGRRPGQKPPPSDALELWVRRKIVWSSRTGPRGGRRKLTISESRGIAFVIARAIGRRGIEGLQFFEEAVQENEAQIRSFFEAAGLQITTELIRPN